MCIIAIKEANAKMFSETVLENIFYNNPHGAGFMYPKNGQVMVKKGFMTYEDFKRALNELKQEEDIFKIPLVVHTRITTHGETSKQNCHPFLVSGQLKDLTALNTAGSLAVAHNGTINITPKSSKLSDTMQYVMDRIAPIYKAIPDFLAYDEIRDLIGDGIGYSKLAYMDGLGNITTIGEFIKDGDYLFSNSTYKYPDYYYDSQKGRKKGSKGKAGTKVSTTGKKTYKGAYYSDYGYYDDEGEWWDVRDTLPPVKDIDVIELMPLYAGDLFIPVVDSKPWLKIDVDGKYGITDSEELYIRISDDTEEDLYSFVDWGTAYHEETMEEVYFDDYHTFFTDAEVIY